MADTPNLLPVASDVAFERESALLWLPGSFIVEVVAWEVGSRLGLAFADPSWEEFGRTVDIETITWGLAVAVVVLLVLFRLVTGHRSTPQLSVVQLLGVLALAAYWIGASVVASGAVVVLATLAAWILSSRREPE